MLPFRCTCNKPFDSQHKLLAHRTNSDPCRRRWEDYVRSFVVDQPAHPEDVEDIEMEDANTLQEQGVEYGTSASNLHLPTPEDDSHVLVDQEDLLKGESGDDSSEDSSEGSVATHSEDAQRTYMHGFPDSSSGTTRRRVPTEPLEQSENLHVETYPSAGSIHAKQPPLFRRASQAHHGRGDGNDYYPFANEMDFELGVWLHESGLSTAKINEFLSLEYVEARMPSFSTATVLRDRIELLPDGAPRWKEQEITPDYGSPIGSISLFHRDPLKAITHLLSRPALAPHLAFAPKRVWTNASKESRAYSEMCTGDWWWDVQTTLQGGSTLIPIIIASDKTHLTDFSGDKKAWPIYMSIGNISTKARRTWSLNAWVIIGYMPIVAWNAPTDIQGTLSSRLFHQCVKVILDSIIDPGIRGIPMGDSLGNVRHCFPRLAAWLADHPEQLLVNCAAGKTCPVTLAGPAELGSADPSPPRTTEWILNRIAEVVRLVDPSDITRYQKIATRHMLNGVNKPFWESLPGYRAEICVAPDLFHGVIRFWRDHLLKWIKRLVGVAEIDARLKALQKVAGFRYFSKGISHLSQWTGREDRELQRVMVALIAGSPKITPRVMQSVRSFHDFLYLVQYRSHDEETIGYLTDALKTFHATKNIFIQTGARRGKGKNVIQHFKIPKMASFHTYEWHIPELGSSTQFTTEITESHHQPLAKKPYRSTNRKNFTVQMCRYLDRRDRVAHIRELRAWRVQEEEKGRLSRALEELSPNYRERVKTELVTSREPTLSKLQKSRLNTSLWLNLEPTLSRVSLNDICTLYCLPTFATDVDNYLRDQPEPSVAVQRGIADVLYVDVWERLRIHVADIQDDNEFSHTHTVEALPPNAQQRYQYGNGHCILVHDTEEAQLTGIEGYRVGQARVFFKLHLPPDPRARARVHRKNVKLETRTITLAYVQYFATPTRPEPDILMYRLSREDLLQNPRRGTVIPIDSISRFIQLIPRFDGQARNELTPETSMEICRSYYVNSFATHQIYQSVY